MRFAGNGDSPAKRGNASAGAGEPLPNGRRAHICTYVRGQGRRASLLTSFMMFVSRLSVGMLRLRGSELSVLPTRYALSRWPRDIHRRVEQATPIGAFAARYALARRPRHTHWRVGHAIPTGALATRYPLARWPRDTHR